MPFYEEEVRYLEANIKTLPSRESQVVFYGSSSIRLWSDFQNCFSWNIINLGFGGSTIAACAWFMPRLLFRFKPKGLVIYAGDNDLAAGRHPEEVCNNLRLMVFDVRRTLGSMPVFFISIKPSPFHHKSGDDQKSNALTKWHNNLSKTSKTYTTLMCILICLMVKDNP